MTKYGIHSIMNRREFVTKTAATCSLICCGGVSLSSLLRSGQEASTSAEKHKFLKDAGMSYNDIFQMAVGRLYLPTVKAVAAEIGMDKLQKVLMEDIKKRVADQVKNLPSRELPAFAQFFKNPNPFTANTWTMEIVQDSDEVLEMRFSECLWAKTFKEATAADIGFKLICSGDYVTAEAFNPNIKLIRDKTLMQGHDCCNHKYVVKG
jgi:hypothetical protein